MTTFRLFDPDVLSLHDAMNQLLSQSVVPSEWRFNGSKMAYTPLNVLETEQGYQLYVLLPGMKPEDIEVFVQPNSVTIKGQFYMPNKEDKQGHWILQEIGTGAFERSVTFAKPIDGDKIETSYEHGILAVWIPISEASRPRRISVTPTQVQQVVSSNYEQPQLATAGTH